VLTIGPIKKATTTKLSKSPGTRRNTRADQKTGDAKERINRQSAKCMPDQKLQRLGRSGTQSDRVGVADQNRGCRHGSYQIEIVIPT